MELIKFDAKRCSLCGKCVEKMSVWGIKVLKIMGVVVGVHLPNVWNVCQTMSGKSNQL